MMQSIYRPGLFADQVIVVSGGGTGIGRATSRELAALGAHVVLCSRSPEHLEPARAEIEAAGGAATALTCNIRDPESVEALFATECRRTAAQSSILSLRCGAASPAWRIAARPARASSI